MTDIQIAETYKQYKPLIRSICNEVSYSNNFPFDELESECNYIFWRAFESFDPDKSKLITWLTHNLKGRLLIYCKGVRQTVPLEEWHSRDPFEFNLPDMYYSLSWESQQIIQIIFDPPTDFVDLISEKDKGQCKGIYMNTIKKYLRIKGWIIPTINKCFKEIKDVLDIKDKKKI